MADPFGPAAVPAPGSVTAPERARLERVAQEFEAVFLAQVLSGLLEGVGGSGLGGPDNEIYRGMLQEEYAKLISRAGGIGVGDAVLREMLKLQEIA